MSAEIVPSSTGSLEFSQNLPNTPGWAQMTQAEKEGIQQITSMALRGIGTEFAGKLMKEVACYQAKQFLKNTAMSVKDWANMNLGPAWRTIYRAAEKIRDNLKYATDDDLLFLAQRGLHGMHSIQTGTVLRVLPSVPAPKTKSAKAREEWAVKVEEAVRGGLSERRKGHKSIPLDEDQATVVAVQTIDRVMPKGTSAESRSWLRKVNGYVMQKRAITGTLQIEQMKIPEGLFPKRGAPRGPRKKRKKVA
jgi:hypothetical protein